jgi:hypothetical protein
VKRRLSPAAKKLKRPPTPGAWPLLVIDSSPVRKKARREYEKVQRDIEKAKAELERFRTEDQPQYAKWLNSHFGALITETRELHEKLYAAQQLVSEVHHEFYLGEHRSIHSAYLAVIRRREHPEEFEKEMKEADEEDDQFRREFENMFGKSEEEFFAKFGFGPDRGPDPFFPRETKSSKPKPTLARLKDLYRSLARRLHPDSGGPRSPQEIEWWHQTQAAYQSGDIEQLELILTLAEMQHNGAKEASVSILQQITDQFKQGLRELKRELKQYRHDAAWNFSKLIDHAPILHQTRESLEAEKMTLAMQLHKFQAQIDAWKLLGETLPGRRRRPGQTRAKSRSYHQNPWF